MDVSKLSGNWKRLQVSLKEKSDPRQPASHPKASQFSSSSPQNKFKRRRLVSGNGKPTKNHVEETTGRPRKRLRPSSKMLNGDTLSATEHAPEAVAVVTTNTTMVSARVDHINGGLNTNIELGKYLALDCEMVGVGPPPHLESALARISIVNYNGDCVYDSYVRPREPVTDWRTHVSGIAPKHMLHARSFENVQADVAALISGRILVGHSIRGDFDALLLSHPMIDIRDTARHPPYRKLAGGGSPKLKILASELLGMDIQTGEHSSIEDARATILLFRRDKDAFEREHAKKWPPRVVAIQQQDENRDQKKKPKKKKKKKR